MRYKVIETFRIRTPHGEDEIQPGDLVKLSPEKARGLLERGKIKPYCYWKKFIVDDCRMPCFEIEARRVLHECSHFKIFWAKRLKEIERKVSYEQGKRKASA